MAGSRLVLAPWARLSPALPTLRSNQNRAGLHVGVFLYSYVLLDASLCLSRVHRYVHGYVVCCRSERGEVSRVCGETLHRVQGRVRMWRVDCRQYQCHVPLVKPDLPAPQEFPDVSLFDEPARHLSLLSLGVCSSSARCVPIARLSTPRALPSHSSGRPADRRAPDPR